jgi:glucose/arabinose dehydrogenase
MRLRTQLVLAGVAFFAGIPLPAATFPPSFHESTVFSGLTLPTVVKFAPDGRVFVAEKSGLVKVYSSLTASVPTVLADLRPRVQDYWDRGLLGLELDPEFPTRPYVYVLYTFDKNPAVPGAPVPTWGDTCPTPPGPTGSGCPVLGRVSRLDASAAWPVQATEQVLVEGFGQQFPSHSVGGLAFGPDGALYVTAGEGASFTNLDYGQHGGAGGSGPGQAVPVNPLGDPPGGIGVAPDAASAEGGALRSQSLRRPPGQPVTLNGALLRIDPDTGAALPDNPLAAHPDANARRIVAYGLRNPFRFALRPGTAEVYVGDVGWNDSEEIDRLDLADLAVPNFGWPCYEGPRAQAAFQAAGIGMCSALYADGSARMPFFSWDHSSRVVAGETCPTGTSSVSGLAFYASGSYPAKFEGALFFTDWARHCIWAMLPDASGVPDPTQVVTFASGLSGGSVNLERGPGGDIFYVDYDGGRIQRIVYAPGNQPPVARVTASPPSGPSPFRVRFDASGSTDPEGDALSYAWDLDDDGAFDDSTAVAPTWTFTTSGPHTVRVAVSDPAAATATASITVYADNQPPVATITSPVSSLAWAVGDVVTFSGNASDPEEGALPGSLRWTLLMHHCPDVCHVHTIQSWTGVSGGSFAAPDHEYPSFLELVLVATDSGGLSAAVSVVLNPATVVLTLTTDPPGLVLAANDEVRPTPFSVTAIVGSSVSVSAPSPQTAASGPVGFRGWSDGGASSHVVVAPAEPLTLRADYRPFADLTVVQSVAPARAAQYGRFVATATVTNVGPHAATGVRLLVTLPAGVTLVGSSPPGACAPSGASLSCALPDVPVAGAASLALTLRPARAGSIAWTLAAIGEQAESSPANNVSTATLPVRPVGDVNDDGQTDILWQNTTTAVVGAWLMNGATFASASALVPDRGPDTNWRLAGLGDFDGDGKPDLVWHNRASLVVEAWLMNGMTRLSVLPLPAASDPSWEIAGVGDFNKDGWPDVVWRQPASGTSFVLYMQGAAATGYALLPTVPPAWQPAGIADLNGDGALDLLWRRSSDGLNAVVLLDGSLYLSSAVLPSIPDPAWLLAGVGDWNGDGKADVVFRHPPSGTDVVVFLDGTSVTGGVLLPAVADPAWTIIAPR